MIPAPLLVDVNLGAVVITGDLAGMACYIKLAPSTGHFVPSGLIFRPELCSGMTSLHPWLSFIHANSVTVFPSERLMAPH